MVQGVSKQVIMLQAKDEDMFEQAIFILKEDAISKGGVTEDDLLKQARLVIRNDSGVVNDGWRYWACGIFGAVITCAVWLAVGLL